MFSLGFMGENVKRIRKAVMSPENTARNNENTIRMDEGLFKKKNERAIVILLCSYMFNIYGLNSINMPDILLGTGVLKLIRHICILTI